MVLWPKGQDSQLKTHRTITKFQNEWVRKMFHDMELYPRDIKKFLLHEHRVK